MKEGGKGGNLSEDASEVKCFCNQDRTGNDNSKGRT